MKIQFINGWKTWPKWWSTRLKALGLLLIAAPDAVLYAWNTLPLDLKDAIPHDWISTTGIFLVIGSSFAQIVRQQDAHKSAESERRARDKDASV